ncbi:hypothetical protein NIES2104_18100 [Leptolyngbya sp. NIES-2104]|nr:hypothetical protein NIES2104_18100 [Leptolyngbya sp. NIES-2104]
MDLSSDKRIDIECGPNSTASANLLNPKSNDFFLGTLLSRMTFTEQV